MSKLTLSAARSRTELIQGFEYGRPYWMLISQEERDHAAKTGAAMPDGSYPIMSCEGENSVDSAIHAVGRGEGSHDAIRKHIIKRAKSLGCTGKIPDDWNEDGSLSDGESKTGARTSALAAPAADVEPPVKKPEPAEPAKPSTGDADRAVTDAIMGLGPVLDSIEKAQSTDPDHATDPNDKKVEGIVGQIRDLYGELVKAQATDVAEDKPEQAEKPEDGSVTAAGPEPEQPKANPVSDNGDIDDDAKCANGDCGHLASAHLDSEDGRNTGACSMQNCECLGMQVDAQPNGQNADGQTDGPAKDGAQDGEAQPDAVIAADTANDPGEHPNAEPDAPAPNQPPAMNGGENMGSAFTIPVAVIEGQPTGDGRQIAPGALSWRVPPIPLMGLATSTHDPNGMDMNDPAVICGRIDTLERVPGQDGTQVVQARGFFLANEDGQYFAELVEQMGRVGVSADIAVEESELQVNDVDPFGFPVDATETLIKGSIMGLTVCPFAAFEGCYIVLGDGTVMPEPVKIPETAEQPETVTAGGQLIHWMTFHECEPCSQGLEVVVASGQGPVAPPAAWFADPGFTEGDGRLQEILDRRGERVIGGKYACPLTITDDGRVFGHIAPWGVCHTGHAGQCILAPRSRSGYAHFKRGQHVITAEGEKIPVGVLTCDAGHADTRGISASQAMAHYDNTATAVADVAIGEDEYGIWVAGAMRPDATEAQVRKLRAASISGDWRQLGGSLELVAALAVNQPGFPLAVVASGQPTALVAAGAGVMHGLRPEPVVDDSPGAQALRAVRSREWLQRFTQDTRSRARQAVQRLR